MEKRTSGNAEGGTPIRERKVRGREREKQQIAQENIFPKTIDSEKERG